MFYQKPYTEEEKLIISEKYIIPYQIKESGLKTLVIAGGVSANRFIFNYLKQEGEKVGVSVYAPPISLCTDNAAMIACCGYYNLINKYGISDINLTAKAHIDYIFKD